MVSNETMLTLNTGAKMPSFGFGTWQAPSQEVETAVDIALRAGYKLIDAAAIYRNEPAVGSGIRKSGVKREDIFLISKLWNTKHHPEDVEPALDKTLKDLGTDYLDLYLMHWPDAFARSDKWFPLSEKGDFLYDNIDPAVTWKAMEKLVATGKVRAIGVCNFTAPRLDALLREATIVPAVNQVEIHPFFQQQGLLEWCEAKGIKLQAYSPIGNNQFGHLRAIDDERVCDLAKQLDLTPAQLVYSWGVQRGYCVLGKSVTPERIRSNLGIKTLPDSAMQALAAMDRNTRYNFAVHWGINVFQEWDDVELKAKAAACRESNLQKFNV